VGGYGGGRRVHRWGSMLNPGAKAFSLRFTLNISPGVNNPAEGVSLVLSVLMPRRPLLSVASGLSARQLLSSAGSARVEGLRGGAAEAARSAAAEKKKGTGLLQASPGRGRHRQTACSRWPLPRTPRRLLDVAKNSASQARPQTQGQSGVDGRRKLPGLPSCLWAVRLIP